MTSVDQQRLRNDALYYQTSDTAGNKVTWDSVKEDAIKRAKEYFADGNPKPKSRWNLMQDMKNKCLYAAIPDDDAEMIELLKSDMSSGKYDLLADVRSDLVRELGALIYQDTLGIVKEYEEGKK